MHDSVMSFVGDCVELYGLAGHSTLEVGSRNINGSVRDLFAGAYIGVDMIDGPGVDQVCRADDLPFTDNSFAVVVCTEMLEHDPYPWLSLPEMARVLRPGGVLILTARGIGFPLHGFPDDYWRFTVSAFNHLFRLAGLEPIRVQEDPEWPGVLGLAGKPKP